MFFNRDILDTIISDWVSWWGIDLMPEQADDLIERILAAEGMG